MSFVDSTTLRVAFPSSSITCECRGVPISTFWHARICRHSTDHKVTVVSYNQLPEVDPGKLCIVRQRTSNYTCTELKMFYKTVRIIGLSTSQSGRRALFHYDDALPNLSQKGRPRADTMKRMHVSRMRQRVTIVINSIMVRVFVRAYCARCQFWRMQFQVFSAFAYINSCLEVQ